MNVAQAQNQAKPGLTNAERQEFYHTSEGSEVFPLVWLKALNAKGTSKPFLSDVERFGLIPDPGNADGLPIGLSAAETADTRFAGFGPMVGVNCAACHVNEVTYKGTSVRIDGAPSRFDLKRFFQEVAESSKVVVSNPIEFTAFLTRLINNDIRTNKPSSGFSPSFKTFIADSKMTSGSTDLSLDKFGKELEMLIEIEKNKPAVDLSSTFQRSTEISATEPKTGASPTVPIGIFASKKYKDFQLKVTDVQNVSFWMPDPKAMNLLGVPSSIQELAVNLGLLKSRIEFLFKMGSFDFAHTPELAGRVDAFGNARNIVFDKSYALPPNSPVSFPHLWGLEHFSWLHWDANTNSIMERNMGQAIGLGAVVNNNTKASTLRPRDIYRLEELARKLPSPKWPSQFPPIDEAKRKAGEEVFNRSGSCVSCHSISSETQDFKEIELDKIGTDRERAESFARPVGLQKQSDAIANVLTQIKNKAYDDNHVDLLTRKKFEHGIKPEWRTSLKYQSRSLEGVWATAPYLHNNSVPTLRDLLKPPSERPKCFLVESREYNPNDVGVVCKKGDSVAAFPDRQAEVLDTNIVGNRNTGHAYGTGKDELSEVDKDNLLEYLKTI